LMLAQSITDACADFARPFNVPSQLRSLKKSLLMTLDCNTLLLSA